MWHRCMDNEKVKKKKKSKLAMFFGEKKDRKKTK